jgi:thiol-disulfide isomerase/thioredoxin
MTRVGYGKSGRVRAALFAFWAGTLACAPAAPPPNDNFINAIPLTGLTMVTATNVGATAEPGEPTHAGENPARSLWWRWTPPFTGSFSIVTSNSFVTNRIPLDTTLSVYTGNSISNLVRVDENDDTLYGEFGATWSRVVFRAYPSETLYIAVDTVGGATGTLQMNISQAGPLAYPWSATNLQGQVIYSSNFLGQVVVVDFWETTCGACIEELPDVIRVQDALQPQGFTFVGLAGDGSPDPVNYYIHYHSVNYPIAMMNGATEYILAGGPVGFPTKVVLDREGRIVGKYLGGNNEAYYRSIVEPLLRSAPPVRMAIQSFPAGSVRLTWPGVDASYQVQRTTDPASGSWTNAGATPTLTNGQYAIVLQTNDPRQFYRLAKP